MTEKEKTQQLKNWVKEGEHLPPLLKDFHDQKDVFKTIPDIKAKKSFPGISWIDGHCYTIDRFLKWMAYCGYTLQKCRAKQSFVSMEGLIQERKDKETKAFQEMLKKDKDKE